MSLTRVFLTSAVTVQHQFRVDGVLTDASGTVAVAVTRLDGTTVVSGSATHGSTGTYTYALPASAVLDTWTVAWSGSIGGVTVVARDTVEHAGGFLFALDDARTELKLGSGVLDATIAKKRIEVEQECEVRICRRAFVPRYAREIRNGTDTERLGLDHSEPRVIRSVTIGGVAWTAGQLAAITLHPDGALTLPVGVIWPSGQPIYVEVEHGWDYPPEEITTAAITRLQSKLNLRASGIPTRAQSFTPGDGGTYRLVLPDRYTTGLPDVDAAYAGKTRARRAVIA